jgi:SAM-dependent methyltransferase
MDRDEGQLGLLAHQYPDERNLSARMRLHQRFSTNSEPWPRWVFDRLAIQPDCAVLELGCGPGTLWSSNAGRLPRDGRIVLTDLSAGMLTAARQALDGGGAIWPLATADAQALPFRDRAFDLVVANHMLYHVPDRARAIAEIRRVLRDGGRLCAATNGLAHLKEIDALVRRFLPGITLDGPAERFGLETGDVYLRQQFANVEVLRYEDSLVVTEAEPLVEYVQSIAPRRSIAADGLDALRQHVHAIIANEGAFRVQKETGLFVAS